MTATGKAALASIDETEVRRRYEGNVLPTLTTRSLDPTGQGRARWATRWKPALNAFAITFEGRIPTR